MVKNDEKENKSSDYRKGKKRIRRPAQKKTHQLLRGQTPKKPS